MNRLLHVLLLFFAASAQAATFYVKPVASGSGNGSDWFQAMGASFTPTRGNVYYLADGSYGARTYAVANSGTSTITLKKATVADHGTSTGWSDALGDGQADFGYFHLQTDYWIIDGQFRSSATEWDGALTTYGIRINNIRADVGADTGGCDNSTFRYVDFVGGGRDTGGSSDDVFYSLYGNQNLTFQYCSMRDAGRCIFLWRGNPTGITVEYTWMGRNTSTAEIHSELASITSMTNCIWRYNIVEDIEGTAVWAFINHGTATNVQWYGNVIYHTAAYAANTGRPPFGTGTGTHSYGISGVIFSADDVNNRNTLSNSKFYNNTMVELLGAPGWRVQLGSGNLVTNNIWVGGDNTDNGGATFSYNYYAGTSRGSDSGTGTVFNQSENIFVNAATNNYRLSGTNLPAAGIALGSPWNLDMDGNTRGADGTWDRGAFEYGVASDTTAPTPNPSTFSSAPAAVDSFSITMTATTASDTGGGIEYFFDETTGNAGGTDSGWQSSTTYVDVGLSQNTSYTYRVKARDASLNETTYSSASSVTTPVLISTASGNCETLNVTTLQVASSFPAAQTTMQFGFTYPAFTGAGGAMTAPQFVTSFGAAMHHPQQYRNWITEGKDIRLLNPAGVYAKHINIRTIYPDDLSHPNHDYVMNVHPEWLLLDGSGNPVSLFVAEEKCVDFANDAYLDWVLNTWLPTEFVDTTDDDAGLTTFYVHDNGNFLAQTITPNCSHSWCAPYKTDAGMQAAWKHMLDRFKARWPNKKILVSTGPVSYQTPAVQLPRFTDVLAHSDGYYSESLTSDHVYWSGQPNSQKRNALETTMQLADWLVANDKYFFPNLGPGDGIEPTQAEVNYGYAFFNLMRGGTKQFFAMIVKDGSGNWQPEVYPEMNLALGAPLEARVQISTNVYRRRFASATAYVNLSDASTNITLPVGTNKNSLGATVASPLTLGAFSGLTVYHY